MRLFSTCGWRASHDTLGLVAGLPDYGAPALASGTAALAGVTITPAAAADLAAVVAFDAATFPGSLYDSFVPFPQWLGVVVHKGRRSGRTYQTPVNVFRTANGFVIALTYGAEKTEWVKNVVAAGGCEVRTGRRSYQADSPRVYHDETRAGIRPLERRVLGLLGAADFLSLTIVR